MVFLSLALSLAILSHAEAVAAVPIPAAVPADYWPQFRGPHANGAVKDTTAPAAWGTNQNVAWTTDIPGLGWSSPVVWGDRVFLTAVTNEGTTEPPKKGLYLGGERPTPSTTVHHWLVLCLDARNGQILWRKEVHAGAPAGPVHVKNTYASPTPVTDGQHVFACFGDVGVFSLDFSGNLVWSNKLDSVRIRNGWGAAASPVLDQDRLYVVQDNEERSSLLALAAKTGETLWRVDRDEKSNWATPFLWSNDKRTELVVSGRKRVRSYDADGHVLWELGGMSSIVIPTPFAADGLLYVCSGYVGDKTRPIFAIRPGASGDISLKDDETANASIAWCQKAGGPYNPSPLVYGKYLYVLYDFGFLGCYEAATGKEVYGKQRLNAAGVSSFTASPWAYQDRVFCLSEDGDTFVIAAGPEYKLVGKNSLQEMCLASPAILSDRLLIRSASRLFCLRNQAER